MNASTISRFDPATMAPLARLAEIAQLFAIGYLRARVRATARRVAKDAPVLRSPAVKGRSAGCSRPRNRLALSREPERACPRRERRGSPTRDSATETTRESPR